MYVEGRHQQVTPRRPPRVEESILDRRAVAARRPSMGGMNTTTTLKNLHWPLIIGLGTFALIRPLVNILGLDDLLGQPGTVLLLTGTITLVWVLAVGLSRVSQPVLTLVAAALVYAASAALLSAILSPILQGELDGPFARPWVLIPLLITNAVWGLVAGVLALLLQQVRGVSTG